MKSTAPRRLRRDLTRRSYAAFALLAALTAALATPAAHAADPEAQLGWGLEFGGASFGVQPTYRLGLAVGDLPLLQHSFRVNAAQAATEDGAGAESGSSSSWVPWVVGGVVAVVALGTDVGEDSRGCVGCVESRREGAGTQIDGVRGDEDGASVGCVGNECVACSDGTVASSCDGLLAQPLRGEREIDVERQRWLDAGTGHMGDLLGR